MYLSHPTPEYGMYPTHTMAPTQETMHAAGAFGRMTLSPDHALEKLAANVRAATTTSASDRAKQIFVQAWYVAMNRSLHVYPLISYEQARSQLRTLSGRKRTQAGPLLFLPKDLRPIRHSSH